MKIGQSRGKVKGRAEMKPSLTVVGILVLVSGIAAGFMNHESLPWVGVVGSFVCLAFANLDSIEFFKASRDGVEAKTRAVIQQARDTLTELQILATHLAEMSLTLVQRSGRMGGYSDEEKDRIKADMLSTLSKLGIEDEKFELVLKEWRRFEALDYVFGILGNSRVPDGVGNEVIEDWKAFRNNAVLRDRTDADVVRAFLDHHGFMTEERRELLMDYEHFLTLNTHRRPDVWRNRRNWTQLQREQAAAQ